MQEIANCKEIGSGCSVGVRVRGNRAQVVYHSDEETRLDQVGSACRQSAVAEATLQEL